MKTLSLKKTIEEALDNAMSYTEYKTLMNDLLQLRMNNKLEDTKLSLEYLATTLEEAKKDLDHSTDKIEKFMMMTHIITSI